MKKKWFRMFCVLLVIPIVFVSSVSAASSARSDTTGNFTVPQGKTYTFKITSSSKPNLVAGSKSFRYSSTKRSGSIYFIKFIATGKAGEKCGFYLNGSRQPIAIANIATETAISDTKGNFTVQQGKAYTFRITFSSKPSLVAGSKAFRYSSTKRSGSTYFIKFIATGKAGEKCGFYLNGGKRPVAIAKIVPSQKSQSAAKDFITIQTDKFTLKVPGDWDTSTRPEVIFQKGKKVIGGISEVSYDAAKPISQLYGNHAKEISKKEIKTFSLPATEVILQRSSPAAAGGQSSFDELHYYLIPKGGKVVYDLNFTSALVDQDTAEKVAQTFKIK